ncbi:hypothetical protein GRI43_12525 [Altererythrobacter luteolus]|uniref:Uncharacterized protein n=1 Tax=Pontixanthobacter luteolus TaxID=295089 RepID=A0A6I4V8L5_9SPHN|nr:hypothetical protein [Pontixanthobacter luteolus]MXP48212.1 hypothetical protein [Pontixanthobacter luteolus]
MAYKDEKIVRVLLDEASAVEERCEGYREELTEAMAEIVQKERAHLFQRTNIVVEISDIVSRVGTFIQLKEDSK